MTPTKFFLARAIGFVIVLIVVAGFISYFNQTTSPILGCYVHILAKDVYTLKINSLDDNNFAGNLQFKNFQKDSSKGTYVGTFINNILKGEYAFQSEGMDSVTQVQFQKVGDNFIRGIDQEGGGVLYDAEIPGSLFKKVVCVN